MHPSCMHESLRLCGWLCACVDDVCVDGSAGYIPPRTTAHRAAPCPRRCRRHQDELRSAETHVSSANTNMLVAKGDVEAHQKEVKDLQGRLEKLRDVDECVGPWEAERLGRGWGGEAAVRCGRESTVVGTGSRGALQQPGPVSGLAPNLLVCWWQLTTAGDDRLPLLGLPLRASPA